MANYYENRLSAERLRACYQTAPARIQQYLQAEIDFARQLIRTGDLVLELGCGYGRILGQLASAGTRLVGIDTSPASIQLARKELSNRPAIELHVMNALDLQFESGTFDRVLCLQNGLSAFHADPARIIREAIRVTRPGGQLLFTTYAEAFWPERLAWFEQQARDGFIGEIDFEKTGNGTIVCKDGFSATTVSAGQFQRLLSNMPVRFEIQEIDHSILACLITTT